MRIAYATGQCRTGSERGGPRYHAVEGSDFGPALCGYRPGRRSNGWSDYEGEQLTCPKCIKKLAKLEQGGYAPHTPKEGIR